MGQRVDGVSAVRLCALLAGLCLLLAGAHGVAGETVKPAPRNYIYGELLGNTLLGVNYERLLFRHAGLRVGVGAPPINEGKAALVLVMPTLLVGSSRQQLEVAAGVLFVSDSTDSSYAVPTAALAYRRRAARGPFFRVGVAVDAFDGRLWVAPGFGVGMSF
jgi:hypothetical protein